MLKFHHNKGILECKYGHLLSQPKNSIIITENAIYFFKKAMKKGVSELRKLSNRIGSLCLALLLSIVTFEMSTVSLAPPRYSLGDVNADGVSDAYDALLVLFHCVDLKRMKGVQIQSADVNGDQMVDTSDALMILQHTVGLVDEYPTGPVLVILGDEDDPLLKRARRDFTKNYTTVKIRIVSTEENGMFVSEEDLAAYMKTSNKAKVPDVCFASLNTGRSRRQQGISAGFKRFCSTSLIGAVFSFGDRGAAKRSPFHFDLRFPICMLGSAAIWQSETFEKSERHAAGQL